MQIRLQGGIMAAIVAKADESVPLLPRKMGSTAAVNVSHDSALN